MNPGDFVPAIFPVGDGPVMIGHEQYIANLRRRKEVITRLCTAVQEFLVLDIDEQLERAAWKPPARPKPTLEQFEQAQRTVEDIQAQIEALEKLCHSLPAETGEYMERLQRPMLEGQLKNAQEWVSMLQSAMETPESEVQP